MVVLVSFSAFLAGCSPGSTFDNVWNKILDVGNVKFLGNGDAILGFSRLLIWLFIFTVFYAVILGMRGGKDEKGYAPMSFFTNAQAGVISAIIATVSAIFLPKQVLAATGVGWATFMGLVLIGGPIVGIALLMWKWPGHDKDGKSLETKWSVATKIILCALLLWILGAMRHHVAGLGLS